MTSFPWQIDRIRLPVLSTLSRRLHTLPLPDMHAAVGISRTKGIALCNPDYSFLSHSHVSMKKPWSAYGRYSLLMPDAILLGVSLSGCIPGSPKIGDPSRGKSVLSSGNVPPRSKAFAHPAPRLSGCPSGKIRKRPVRQDPDPVG